jgi:hypothetical protein
MNMFRNMAIARKFHAQPSMPASPGARLAMVFLRRPTWFWALHAAIAAIGAGLRLRWALDVR